MNRKLLAGVVLVVGFTAIYLGQDIPVRHHVEGDLTRRSVAALRGAGLSTVDVQFVGRDGTVHAHTRADADRALAIVRAQDGVRVADAVVDPAPAPSPSPTPAPSPSPGPSTTPSPVPSDVQNQLTGLPNITFETDSATLTAQGRAVVANVATILQAHPTVRVRIEGHTDSTGTPARNLALSQARAETVRTTLASLGVDPARMATAGFGATRPLVPDTTPENQAINRRVQFVVLN
jgi:outer membrane protein OmpA-like peptidoglycan-associated protein